MINWDSNILPSLGRIVRYKDLRFGIELECERYADPYDHLEHWDIERDASLRNDGAEYVSHPLRPVDVPAALREAKDNMDEHQVIASWRCGVHVHVNVSFWTWRELIQFAVLSTLVEPYIYDKFAKGRETSHFCVPTWSNTRLVDNLAKDATMIREGPRGMMDARMLKASKYCSINYRTIGIMGTVEMRHLPGTVDMQKVQAFVTFLEQLVHMAHSYDMPEGIITEYEDLGPMALLERLDLHTCEPDPLDVEDALIAATLICGHDPIPWQNLEWTMPPKVDDPMALEAWQRYREIEEDLREMDEILEDEGDY